MYWLTLRNEKSHVPIYVNIKSKRNILSDIMYFSLKSNAGRKNILNNTRVRKPLINVKAQLFIICLVLKKNNNDAYCLGDTRVFVE